MYIVQTFGLECINTNTLTSGKLCLSTVALQVKENREPKYSTCNLSLLFKLKRIYRYIHEQMITLSIQQYINLSAVTEVILLFSYPTKSLPQYE